MCETCPGSLLLIDVDNMPHYDHGKCVESCPPGLVADCKFYKSFRIKS